MRRLKAIILFFLFATLMACKTSGPGLFAKKTPHEQYADKLKDAGLQTTALGKLWLDAAARSLSQPLDINLPYKESGYFAAERPTAAGLRFSVKRGQKIFVSLDKKPQQGFAIYLDLWRIREAGTPKYIASADTSSYRIEEESSETASYIVRLQPELLRSGEYTVTITTGPSLAYPIKAPGRNHTKSFWGASRDGGSRQHEGIDMFAARGTPVVAAADGWVSRVNENNLGGKVVWMRPANKNYSLYYAHLDSQLVRDGQQVKKGDTLGLMGNTGNAKSTSPHLHFGIYTFGGAVDPYPFINPDTPAAPKITASLARLGELGRITRPARLVSAFGNSADFTTLSAQTLVRVEAATDSWFKVKLPDAREGFLSSAYFGELKPIRKTTISTTQPLLDSPDSTAAKKTILPGGKTVDVLATFGNFLYVSADQQHGWIEEHNR